MAAIAAKAAIMGAWGALYWLVGYVGCSGVGWPAAGATAVASCRAPRFLSLSGGPAGLGDLRCKL
jgi:hypothetical protein